MPTTYQDFLIEHVKQSIEKAKLEKSNLTYEILSLEGLSSDKIRHLINNICSIPHAHYLEIGTWKGATFISALYKNRLSSGTAIDNWKQFTGTKDDFEKNAQNFLDKNSYTAHEANCFNFDLKKIQNKIDIYFYDANHTKKDQKNAFTYYDSVFNNTFIAIVDNYNWIQVQEGTQEAFKELNYNILFEQFLASTKRADKDGWWTGIYVAVISKN